MAVTVADIREFASEAQPFSDAVIDRWLAMASDFLDEAAFEDAFDTATLLWTSHQLALQGRGATTALTSRRVGEVAATYAAEREGTTDYEATVYGRRLLTLMRVHGATPASW